MDGFQDAYYNNYYTYREACRGFCALLVNPSKLKGDVVRQITC